MMNDNLQGRILNLAFLQSFSSFNACLMVCCSPFVATCEDKDKDNWINFTHEKCSSSRVNSKNRSGYFGTKGCFFFIGDRRMKNELQKSDREF